MHELRPGPERCLLAGITWKNSKWVAEDYLSELAELAQTAGADVIDYFIQERSSPDSAYFIGKGKATEIKEYIIDHAIDLLIFDDELSTYILTEDGKGIMRFTEKLDYEGKRIINILPFIKPN